MDKNEVLKKILKSAETNIASALRLLSEGEAVNEEEVKKMLVEAAATGEPIDAGGGRVVEGVFDGTHMVGSDGKQYAVPPNYASKSKLVEGDMLKLVIAPGGKFMYKQIGPIERERLVGVVEQDQVTKQFSVISDGKKWNALTASITYFKGEAGDEAVILVPKNNPSKWAAVENVIKKI
ncbi:hypothetical protein HYT45_03425 [Candidatus Uhrbacteria bacterium]|nr:hypothetical protein [Candidatus Uhrbacteria bacterium]